MLKAASVSGNRSGLSEIERTAFSSVLGGTNKSRLSNGRPGGGENAGIGSHAPSAAASPFEERRRKGSPISGKSVKQGPKLYGIGSATRNDPGLIKGAYGGKKESFTRLYTQGSGVMLLNNS